MFQHLLIDSFIMSHVFGVYNQIQHKLGCTTSEGGWRLEILDLESTGIVLSM